MVVSRFSRPGAERNSFLLRFPGDSSFLSIRVRAVLVQPFPRGVQHREIACRLRFLIFSFVSLLYLQGKRTFILHDETMNINQTAEYIHSDTFALLRTRVRRALASRRFGIF